MFPQIPFAPGTPSVTGFSADVGRHFQDKHGNVYVLNQLSTALSGGVTADGDVMFFKSDNIATNDPTEAEDTSNPRAAGVACGATVSSTGATETTIFYDLHLIRGKKDVVKCAAGIAAGDGLATSLQTGGTPVAGQAQRVTKGSATNGVANIFHVLQGGFIGVARTAVSGGFCKAFLNVTA